MITLTGLAGLSTKTIEAESIRTVASIEGILKRGHAATIAKTNGAINIWEDDRGKFRCESMRFCMIMSSKKFSTISDVKEWYLEHVKTIK